MLRQKLRRPLALLLSVAMLTSSLVLSPMSASAKSADETAYFESSMDTTDGWTINNDCTVQTVTDGDRNCLLIKSPEGNYSDNDVIDNKEPSITQTVSNVPNEIYVVEFDVKFTAANVGAIQLMRGLPKTDIGPSIYFDGKVIRCMTGKNSYVTMRSNAVANEWYNVKLVFNGKSSCYSYVTNTTGTITTEKSSKDLKRNLKNGSVGGIKFSGLSTDGQMYVDNVNIYKPSPTSFEMSAVETTVAVPVEGEDTLTFSCSNVVYNGIEMDSYKPLNSGILLFKLYDESNTQDLSSSMPKGVSLDSKTGVLTVSSEASPANYTVRLESYTGGYYQSQPITLQEAERVVSVQMAEDNTERLPKPNAGTQVTPFKAVSINQYGEVYSFEDTYTWELLNEDQTPCTASGISINSATGEISVSNTATLQKVRIKATSNANPEQSVISDVIEMYQMEAAEVQVNGSSTLKVSDSDSVSTTYTEVMYDQEGYLMPAEEHVAWSVTNADGDVSIDQNGVLTVEKGAKDQTVTVTATADSGAYGIKEVAVYNAVAADIDIKGNMAGVIPESGSNSYHYSAVSKDQYGFDFEGADFTWSIEAENTTGLSMTEDGTLTVSPDAENEQTIQVVATPTTNAEPKKYPVIISEQIYTYLPVKGGFEINDGTTRYSRPLYSSHVNDDTGVRIVGFVGDEPDFMMLRTNKAKKFNMYAHMFLGVTNGDQTKWLKDMDHITFRYIYGRAEYDITDSSFDGTIRLIFTRTDEYDGFLLKVEMPEGMEDKLVVATAADGGASVSQQTGGNNSGYEFKSSNAKSTSAFIQGNTFSISKSSQPTVSGSANVSMNYAVKDAGKFADLSELLDSSSSSIPMVVGTTEGNAERDIYLILTTESLDNAGIQSYLADPEAGFDHGVSYMESVSKAVDVTTPDPYFDSTVAAQTVGMDASWISPTIQHGPIAWFTPHAGWRSNYGQTVAGYTDRVSLNAQQYMKSQREDGRIKNFPTSDKRYNMGEVLVDQYLYNWLWTGDLDEMENGGYEFVTKHLNFIEEQMKVPGTNLYENWLNAWNTDNKWANGGASTIETAYVWRAYDTIADIAQRLGKTEDAQKYQEKADTIKAEMKDTLWSDEKGVYAEYKDYFGEGLLHTDPDLSSIYTPIDVGITDQFEEYQMLHYADVAIPNLAIELPRGGVFKESSNWLPSVYSSRGIYEGELINQILACYQNGQADMADEMMRGLENGLFNGAAAGPGLVSHMTTDSATNSGHLDFSDVSSMVVRTAVEGTFGIKMNVPDKEADITPSFPTSWDHASINTSYLGYTYEYKDGAENLHITSEQELSYNLSLKAKSSNILSVKVNGQEVDYTMEAGINNAYITLKTPLATSADIEVVYGTEAVPTVAAPEVGSTEEPITVQTTGGTISQVYDPQGILASSELNGDTATFILNDNQGDHTFFVLVEQNDVSVWIPVDLSIESGMELTNLSLEPLGDGTFEFQFSIANNTQTAKEIKATVKIGANTFEYQGSVSALAETDTRKFTLNDLTGITDGNTTVKATITGDYNKSLEGDIENWNLSRSSDEIVYAEDNTTLVDLDSVVNQDLRTLHSNTYTITYNGQDDYTIPNFYWVSDTTRSVTQTGRAWWEDSSRGKNGVPSSLNLPEDGGVYKTDMGVPFDISSVDGHNAVFVSKYNNFPETVNIPVSATGQKLYFMVAVSTNHMQSYVENARITVNLKDGTQKVLSLSNPENIDDWLSYQTKKPYAQTGFIQELDNSDKAHANILSIDLGSNQEIESVDFTCVANEVLAGMLGITVVEGNNPTDTNKFNLNYYLNVANKAIEDGAIDNLVVSAQKAIRAAVTNGQAVLDDQTATQEQVDAAAVQLREAIQMLGMIAGDKTALQAAVDQANELLETVTAHDYEQSAIDVLKNAVGIAQGVLDDGDAFQKEVNEALEQLMNAIENLEASKKDWRALNALVEDGTNNILPDIENGKYIENETIDQYKQAYDKGFAILEEGTASQADIDAACDLLREASIALRYKADKSVLNDLIQKAEGINLDEYESSSVVALKAALDEAKEVSANSMLSQDDQQIVDRAAKKLEEALAALETEDDTATEGGISDSDKDSTSSGSNNKENKESNDIKTGDSNPLPFIMASATITAVVGIVFRKKEN